MKITRRQLERIILKEFKNLPGNFSDLDLTSGPPDLPPIDDNDEGGPPKDWPMEVIARLKKVGYKVFVRSDGVVPFKRQVYKNMPALNVNITVDALQEGVVVSIGYERDKYTPNGIASTKFIKCFNAVETNNAMRIIISTAKTLQRKDSLSIHEDIRKLESSGAKDPVGFTMEEMLNEKSFLIDYYVRQR